MTRHRALLMWIVFMFPFAWGQGDTGRTLGATVSGLVIKDPTGEPVKKALVELISENQKEAGNYTALSGPDGLFRMEHVQPGRYRLFAERTGYLEFDKSHPRTDGRVLTVRMGEDLKEITIHFRAAAVVEGRISDEDGDPLPEAQVAVLRPTYSAGHSHWEQVGAERTNDLGQYRIANLPAGTYFIAVTPPPNFKTLIETAGNTNRTVPRGTSPEPSSAYATTYYPDTRDRGQAAPVQLHAGEDFPANFSLVPVATITLRGSIVNLPARAAASILLQSRDSQSTVSGVDVRKDGTFEIRDVSPGKYSIVANVSDSPVPMMARQSLQVLDQNIEDLRLSLQTGTSIRGHIQVETAKAGFAWGQMLLSLVSDDDLGGALFDDYSPVAHVNQDGRFEWKNVPAGHYNVVLAGGGGSDANWFLKSVLLGGRDASEDGFTVGGGAVVMEVTASSNGATAEGFVLNAKGEPVPNCTVVLVPELRFRSRTDRFRKVSTDQGGRFEVRSIPPGSYTLLAWEMVEDDAYYDPSFLRDYEGQGVTLRLVEGDRKQAKVVAIPAPVEQE